jgi:hypothetical protein
VKILKIFKFFLFLLLITPSCIGQGSLFTYQGRLLNNGSLASGNYDLRFGLTDQATNGNYVSSILTNIAVPVSNGVFAIGLDFGKGPFDGSARWLEVSVRTNGSALLFTPLFPRQLLNATPYATRASAASAADMASNLFPGAIISGNGAGITNLNGGNISAGTITANQFDAATWQAATATATNTVQAIGDQRYAGINLERAWLTPFDCGAIGDGITDDTTALQTWLYYACISNLVAFLPPAPGGFYKITDTLWITNGMNNVNIQGAGGAIHVSDYYLSKCCIKQFGAGKDGIVITNAQSGIYIEGIRLQHNVYSYGTRGIAFDGNNTDSDCSAMDRVGIMGFGKGLVLSSVADFTVRNCSFGFNGEGVYIGPGTYTTYPVLNNLQFFGCQISYNRSNNIYMVGGTVEFNTLDIAQVDGGAHLNDLCHGVYLTNGYATFRYCNFENDLPGAAAQPCVVASGAGQITFDGGSSQGPVGPNTYTLVTTNVTIILRNFAPNCHAADGYGILEDVTAYGGSQISGDSYWIPFKAIFYSTVYEGRVSMGMRNWWGYHGPLPMNATLFQNHSTLFDANGVSQGGYDDISSFLVGAKLNGYLQSAGTVEVDLYHYEKDLHSYMGVNNFRSSNLVYTVGLAFPTNQASASVIDLNKSRQFIATNNSVSLNGVANSSTTEEKTANVIIMNTGASFTLTLPSNWATSDGRHSYVCTNGVNTCLTISAVGGLYTNATVAAFWGAGP